ncbi:MULTISPECIES: hypothetical protein [Vibrio]|uniref:Uncharacterized protein n=1 Tax=Vibrio tasmaniensis TaxID=212663 RepID=A0A2N7NCQ7_9VIBR|nr:hypothetical protein [Vibrio tasmaniensis]PMO89844.1 hypothetical protein BCT01_00765 [Vibrio tasmaniensis]PMP09984.1 hypothetical protein BCS92_02325 [Vibrio tasmaniensis]TKG32634.1 hypothetical protein FC057_12525 [Vibrio tasmaniensis]TKG41682.1 hypothetical protein FC063_07415 [Vibrio tasmaniensis]TKG52037.1 hypothetical protein FC070_09685 [Vibrio tasmaniensis]
MLNLKRTLIAIVAFATISGCSGESTAPSGEKPSPTQPATKPKPEGGTNPTSGDLFSTAISVGGHSVFIGAPSESSSSKGLHGDRENNDLDWSGAVYIH